MNSQITSHVLTSFCVPFKCLHHPRVEEHCRYWNKRTVSDESHSSLQACNEIDHHKFFNPASLSLLLVIFSEEQ
ncbi:hypothetical protein LIER_11745 [Lithospermum erythrorhizon]|uniref:Uncharacterized protein n=1 Tax=Lithospermum erythrorhizon TaxID=34254 RepID=A0AAV3PP53_LITER